MVAARRDGIEVIALPPFFSEPQRAAVVLLFLGLSLILVLQWATGRGRRIATYLQYLWGFLLVFSLAELVSFTLAVWILAGLCFLALREFFSLITLRFEDRWAMLGAYLSIPFMSYFIQIDWYGMFIISIPVYAFLVVPVLVALGGRRAEGTVFSIGVIDFGLFLFVYCTGHIGYLAQYSSWKAILLVLNVAASDMIAGAVAARRGAIPGALAYPVAAAVTLPLTLVLSPWTGIPLPHSAALGLLIPALVWVARWTLAPIEADLRIDRSRLLPGRGEILNSLKSFLFAAPLVFHYVRYFLG
jgi:phosphatidate cytidylyltransferase